MLLRLQRSARLRTTKNINTLSTNFVILFVSLFVLLVLFYLLFSSNMDFDHCTKLLEFCNDPQQQRSITKRPPWMKALGPALDLEKLMQPCPRCHAPLVTKVNIIHICSFAERPCKELKNHFFGKINTTSTKSTCKSNCANDDRIFLIFCAPLQNILGHAVDEVQQKGAEWSTVDRLGR